MLFYYFVMIKKKFRYFIYVFYCLFRIIFFYVEMYELLIELLIKGYLCKNWFYICYGYNLCWLLFIIVGKK